DTHDADDLRRIILERFDMSLGAGLGKLAGKVFRIGHLGAFNDLMLAGTLSGVEMGLRVAGVPHRNGGVLAALDVLADAQHPAERVSKPLVAGEPVRLKADATGAVLKPAATRSEAVR